MSPPKPRLTLRVGVTGHRPNKFAPDAVTRVRPQLVSVLKRLCAALDTVHRVHPDAYDAAPPVLRVISPLAEGADRLVADEALALGAELVAPLPFARDFY
jgi:hypothetical protein